MARMSSLPPTSKQILIELDCPTFGNKPWVTGPPLNQRRVAIVSSGGLIRRGEAPFRGGDGGYRAIPDSAPVSDILMSHVSVNFDRTGFQQDANVAYPRDRLHEMAASGEIGSVAATHYSFMGATDPREMEDAARELADHLKEDGVDAALLLPV